MSTTQDLSLVLGSEVVWFATLNRQMKLLLMALRNNTQGSGTGEIEAAEPGPSEHGGAAGLTIKNAGSATIKDTGTQT